MFSGLITERGELAAVVGSQDGTRLRIRCEYARECALGDSVAVSGVCLTAIAIDAQAGWLEADVMHETLKRSTLGQLQPGAALNIEPALRADARLGGHIVQGHVDATAPVLEIRTDGLARVLKLQAPKQLMSLIVEKGSVTLDGVSLTVSAVAEHDFEVSLIPETQQRTSLGTVSAGDRVNLETDILAKHMQRLIAPYIQNAQANRFTAQSDA